MASAQETTTDPKAPSFKTASSDLRSALPNSGRVRRLALSQLSTANRALKRGDECGARKAFSGLRSLALRPGSGRPSLSDRSQIAAHSLQAETLLLFRKGASRCGGAKTAPASRAGLKVLSKTPTQVVVDLRLPAPIFEPSSTVGKGADSPFVRLNIPGLDLLGDPGEPGIPALSEIVAIPNGATPQVKVLASSSVSLPGVDLEPEQAPQPEQDPNAVDAPPEGTGKHSDPRLQASPFQRNAATYRSAKAFPSSPVSAGLQGDIRGLKIMSINTAASQYFPSRRALRVYTNVRLQINFTGGTGKFADQRLASAADQLVLAPYLSSMLNGSVVLQNLGQISELAKCGEDMVLFTTPALKSAADRYAAARTSKGVVTRVFVYGEGGLNSADAMRAHVMSRIYGTNCERRPSYVLLMGDHPALPTFKLTKFTNSGAVLATDLHFGTQTAGSFFPSAFVGRLPAENLAEADAVVDKLIGFVNNPPNDPNFYNRATVAGFFQIRDEGEIVYHAGRESRTFIYDAERSRTALMLDGKTVDRYYTKESGSTPVQFNNGNLLPSSLVGNNFAWNDTGEEIRTAINQGRYLLLHRDHGFWRGWGDPEFDNGGAAAPSGLTNGNKLPLVLSINCESGYFDLNPGSKSFAESLVLDPDGGAFAVVAASRVSWTPTNSPLARGLAGTFTGKSLLPMQAPVRFTNLGQAMLMGKLMMSIHTTSSSERVKDTYRMFNLFGDPSMSLKTTL